MSKFRQQPVKFIAVCALKTPFFQAFKLLLGLHIESARPKTKLSQLFIMKRPQSGFTLVEIAIVLVIIGLLLGGVLKGQELIVQARIKNILNDFTGITTAVYAYQDRFKALPGDDRNGARWADLGSTVGDGNGIVDSTDEEELFWADLRKAG